MSEIAQGSGFYRRRIGDVVVTAINDGMLDLPLGAMSGIEAEAASALLQAAFRAPAPRPSVNAFLVQGNGATVLVDTGGGVMAPTLGRLQDGLAAAGVAPGDVDTVVMTHLHPDHTGGLTSPAGEAVFPNAELVIAQPEADFWLNEALAAAAPEERKAYFAGAQAAVAPYRSRLRLFTGADNVAPGIQAHPLPGHTPGHTGYLVTSGDATLLIWGDVLHVQDVQSHRPEVGMVFDADPEEATRSRLRVLDMAARDRLMVAGMHLHFPAFSHVRKLAEGYTLVPDAWSGTV